MRLSVKSGPGQFLTQHAGKALIFFQQADQYSLFHDDLAFFPIFCVPRPDTPELLDT